MVRSLLFWSTLQRQAHNSPMECAIVRLREVIRQPGSYISVIPPVNCP